MKTVAFASNDTDAADKLMYSRDTPTIVHLRESIAHLLPRWEVDDTDEETFAREEEGSMDVHALAVPTVIAESMHALVEQIQSITGGWVMLHSLFYRPIVHGSMIDNQAMLQPLYKPLFAFVMERYMEFAMMWDLSCPVHELPLLEWLDEHEMNVTDYNTRVRVQAMDGALVTLRVLMDKHPLATPQYKRSATIHAWVLQEYIQRLWNINDQLITVRLLPYMFHTARHIGLLLVQTLEMQHCVSSVQLVHEWVEASEALGSPSRQLPTHDHNSCPAAPLQSSAMGSVTPDADEYVQVQRQLLFA